jgi:hypothetical protein
MKLLMRLFWMLVLTLIALFVGAALMMPQNAPSLDRLAEVSPEQIKRGKKILDENDPRRLKPGEVRSFYVNRGDVDAAVNYLANQFGRGAARVDLTPGHAHIRLTSELPANPLGRYLNVDAELAESDGLPGFESLRIGAVPIPGFVANQLATWTVKALRGSDEHRFLTEIVQKVRVSGDQLGVTYRWQENLRAKLGGVAIAEEDQERLRIYWARLAELSRSMPPSASLAELTHPVFSLAVARSAQGECEGENRAAILALTFYAIQRDFSAVLPQAERWPKPRFRTVTLHKRDDLPKHFLLSATLSSGVGGPLANAFGLYKELSDMGGRGGFSFDDIAADRAGTRLGELAVADAASAKKLQGFLSAANQEADFMPDIKGLPKYIPEAEFKRRYGGVGGPDYKSMMDEIERRVAALAFNR